MALNAFKHPGSYCPYAWMWKNRHIEFDTKVFHIFGRLCLRRHNFLVCKQFVVYKQINITIMPSISPEFLYCFFLCFLLRFNESCICLLLFPRLLLSGTCTEERLSRSDVPIHQKLYFIWIPFWYHQSTCWINNFWVFPLFQGIALPSVWQLCEVDRLKSYIESCNNCKSYWRYFIFVQLHCIKWVAGQYELELQVKFQAGGLLLLKFSGCSFDTWIRGKCHR